MTDCLAWITGIATVVVAVATVVYASLVYGQLRLGQPDVRAYIATRGGRPFVNVTNTGAASAYRVRIGIHWSAPPAPVTGGAESVDSPEYGKLVPGETVSFESPHSLIVKDHFKTETQYSATVRVQYERLGGKTVNPAPFVLDYGKHVRAMRRSRQRSQP